MKEIPDNLKKIILSAQKNEITEYHIYRKLAASIRNGHNRDVLTKIAEAELRHYNFWKKHTGKEIHPAKFKIWHNFWISKLFGITFGIKLMETGEGHAQHAYKEIEKFIPDAKIITQEEHDHENKLIELIDEEKLKYVGSIVLGLNDALVELTGALAGLTLALKNTGIIAVAGLITGIAASFSMAASEYLSAKTEKSSREAVKSAIYTGVAYIITVILLIIPFLTVSNVFLSLAITLLTAIAIIFLFNFYFSVAKNLPFKKRFFEMAVISLGVAALTFGIGFFIRKFFNVEI